MGELLFNKYEVQKTIGKGGFSSVLLVRDTHLNKLMAMKKYSCDIGRETEVDTLKNLQHDGLPIIYDYRELDDEKYLFMEYVDGMTLREYLDLHRVVPMGIAVKWIREIAGILDYLHGLNPTVIYRDLKPENIMIKKDGQIKLIDFGGVLLRLHTSKEKRQICGTMGYSAPEILKGRPAECSADIYSLGVVFYEMLTGAQLKNPDMEYQGIRSIDRAFPKGIDIVIGNCLGRKPAMRYQTMKEFIYDLDNYKKLIRSKGIVFMFKKLAVFGMYIIVLASLFVPLLKGVKEEIFPFPFLKGPIMLLAIAVALNYLLLGRSREKKMKVIKSLLLTEKKSNSILIGLFFAVGLSIGLLLGNGLDMPAFASERSDILATNDKKEMWVDLCDTFERKMLLKNDAVYKVEDKVRFEIPRESIPKGEMKIQISAIGNDGSLYQSRAFNVSNKSD